MAADDDRRSCMEYCPRGSGGKREGLSDHGICTNYADDQVETQGLVKPDKMQSIYVSETQKITKYYVHEGYGQNRRPDFVLRHETPTCSSSGRGSPYSAGDRARRGERQSCKGEQLPPVSCSPILPTRAGYAAHAGGGAVFPRAAAGTKDSLFFYIWSNNCAYDSSLSTRS